MVQGDEIGAVYADAAESWFAGHARQPSAPKGPGDLLTALFAAWMIGGENPSVALSRAVGGVAESLAAAQAWRAPELPIVGLGARVMGGSDRVRLERLV